VIPADERNALGIPYFEGEEEEEGFYAIETAINEVPWREGEGFSFDTSGSYGIIPIKR
jgi:hypothetical protein